MARIFDSFHALGTFHPFRPNREFVRVSPPQKFGTPFRDLMFPVGSETLAYAQARSICLPASFGWAWGKKNGVAREFGQV